MPSRPRSITEVDETLDVLAEIANLHNSAGATNLKRIERLEAQVLKMISQAAVASSINLEQTELMIDMAQKIDKIEGNTFLKEGPNLVVVMGHQLDNIEARLVKAGLMTEQETGVDVNSSETGQVKYKGNLEVN